MVTDAMTIISDNAMSDLYKDSSGGSWIVVDSGTVIESVVVGSGTDIMSIVADSGTDIESIVVDSGTDIGSIVVRSGTDIKPDDDLSLIG